MDEGKGKKREERQVAGTLLTSLYGKKHLLADDFLAVDDVDALTQAVELYDTTIKGGDGLRAESRTADSIDT